MTINDNRPIVVCMMPGPGTHWQWTRSWTQTHAYLLHNYKPVIVFGTDNNIYRIRASMAREICNVTFTADYIWWIDSDNPPTIENFEMLRAVLDTQPEVSAVGGWYPMDPPLFEDGKQRIAAGFFSEDWLGIPILRKEIEQWTNVRRIGYIGFGCLVMRHSLLRAIGPTGFQPIIDDNLEFGFETDDLSFCRRAKDYNISIHPGAKVRHQKLNDIPDEIPAVVMVGA